jgi:hypothetical protein
MKNANSMVRAAAAAAVLSLLAGVPATAPAAQQGDAVTISWSGATFMRSFTTSRGISLLTPGTSITLNAGPGGTPVTFSAPSGPTTSVQLAAQNLTSGVDPYSVGGPNNAATANYYAIRFEWHEQGSIEGVSELINDQIGQLATVAAPFRNGSAGNPLWVNSNPYGQNGINSIPLPPTYSTVTVNGHSVATSDYDPQYGTPTTGGSFDDTNAARPGRNKQGGQNRVQQAVSDVVADQGFSVTGASNWNRIPGSPGYGKGNQALPAPIGNIQGVGEAGTRKAFNDASVINMPTSKIDPGTGTNYQPGPWNNAGLDNLDNRIVAVGGLAYVVNPGTGLTRINRADNVWLHTTGRLENGADFNSVSRDIYSGTINTASNNLGLDTSWATGENDDGNTGADNPDALAETRIGPKIKFSGKTSGGQGVRPTVQNSRMAFGHLSSSDAIPAGKQSSSRPMRVLEYRDDWDDFANGSNNTLPPELRNNAPYADPSTSTNTALDVYEGFTRLTAKSLVEGSYAAATNQTYVTVKAPNPAFASDTPAQWAARRDTDTGIKGDNSGNDVRDFRDNIFQSVANFPSPSVGNPADQLLALSYLLPQLSKVTKDFDGLNRYVPNPDFNAALAATFLASPLATPFVSDDPRTVTTGTNSNYGNNNIGNGSGTPTGGSIRINNGNWLFGDFDQRPTNIGSGISGKGFRDFSDLVVAQQAQAALESSGLGNDWNAVAGSNATAVTGLPAALNTGTAQWGTGSATTPTKGDLIVLGDFNSDGKFDGKDLYRMARGTSLATGSGTTILGADGLTFQDAVRRGQLRKNAALDLMHSIATATQKQQASANPTNDPTGANAFRKEDVNRDGLIDLKDAKLVDFYCEKSYRNLDHQLAAVQGLDGDSPLYTLSTRLKPIDLVDVELNDSVNGRIDTFDFGVIRTALGTALRDGDTDFNGLVDFDDYARIDAGFIAQNMFCWSTGDFDSNGTIDFDDYTLIDNEFLNGNDGRTPLGAWAAVQPGMSGHEIYSLHAEAFGQAYIDAFNNYISMVPEPASAGAAGLALVALLGRRRRNA